MSVSCISCCDCCKITRLSAAQNDESLARADALQSRSHAAASPPLPIFLWSYKVRAIVSHCTATATASASAHHSVSLCLRWLCLLPACLAVYRMVHPFFFLTCFLFMEALMASSKTDLSPS